MPSLAAVGAVWLFVALTLSGCLRDGDSDAPTPAPPPAPPVAPGPVGPPAPPPAPEAVRLVEVASGLHSPLWMVEHPTSGALLVAEQDGRIVTVTPDPTGEPVEGGDTWLDLTDRITAGGEQGLLGFALHPDFVTNGVLVVSYTDVDGDSVVSRFLVDGAAPDPSAEEILLTVDQPFANHNGGHALWGPDGHLYFGLGDGGAASDPMLNGQNLNTLLGSLLRIDVGASGPYTVPDDNPFVDQAGAQPEIWAYGLRNPWRFHFDSATGDLWIGDVGQDVWEEVDFQSADSPGGENYGWNLFEGNHQYPSDIDAVKPERFTFPVAEYSHDGRHCSVTMGPAVRDPGLPELAGRALLADFCSGQMWSLAFGGALEPLMETGFLVSSFAEDAGGGVYVMDHAGGRLLRLEATQSS